MSALSVWAGLEACLRGIDGLANVMLGEPTAVHETPALYVALASIDVTLRNMPPARNLNATTYGFVARLIVRWQDNAQAELQLITLADAIPDAIRDDPRLGGRLTGGIASVTSGVAGFVTIGGTLYRIVDYDLTVLEKESA